MVSLKGRLMTENENMRAVVRSKLQVKPLLVDLVLSVMILIQPYNKGIPVNKVTIGAWAFATALGCLAAVMVAPLKNVTVSMMDSIHLNSFIASVLGGFSTFYGPVVASFIIGIANNLLGYYVSTKWSLPLLYALILLFIVLRPNGLFGKKIVKKV